MIAIEGIDGAGKATQAKLLKEAAERGGQLARVFSFPDYTTPTGKLIAAYLRGEVTGDPRFIASMYSLNRQEKLNDILSAIQSDRSETVIFDRYAYSNIHNMAHFVDRGLGTLEEAEAFIAHVEWEVCRSMRVVGSSNVLLDLPEGFAQKQVADKAARAYTTEKADIHEADAKHLSTANAIYRHIAARDGWTVINCTREDEAGGLVMRTPEDINAEIIRRVSLW